MSDNSTATPTSARGTLPMTVANMTFMVNRLSDDCAPLQFIRELTQNAIEAVGHSAQGVGQVIWDVDWSFHALNEGVFKLACIDTGVGMDGPEMVQYINKLSSSIHQQSTSGNFGVGAKISAAPRNPEGLVYMSWKNGVGSMIHLWFDPEERVYGLKRWPQNHGEFWAYVSPDLKPEHITDHGTMVVLLGKSDDDNTMEPPLGTPMRSRWILRYLNTRYFRFPQGVTVKAREGWELPRTNSRHNFLREIHGQGVWLNDNCAEKGTVELTNATAHWWILKEDIDKDSGHTAPGGHVAALFQNELYEMVVGRAGLARLQGFGIIFGTDRVVIYVEPRSQDGFAVTSNTARTQLLMNGEPLAWPEWASEFRDHMPDALKNLQDEIGAKVGETDYKKAIRERLKQIRDLLRFTRFKPAVDGVSPIDPEAKRYGGQDSTGGGTTRSNSDGGQRGSRAGDIYALFAEAGNETGDPIDGPIEPDAIWVTAGNGRTPPDLDDRAAKFLLQQNKLLINGDFRVFTDMIDRWVAIYSKVPGARSTIKEVVREWFQQQLIETVMSALALRRTGKWSMQELEKLWTEEALTAAVLPRWHIDQSIKRMLGHRLGKSDAA